MNFDNFHEKRKAFLLQNKNKDHVVLLGENKILLSAPHGVSQIRLGKYKVCEIGSLAVALFLKENSNCSLIAKTKNNSDDANFDLVSPYKNTIKKLVKESDIKYIVDIHGLASSRECDVNLGVHLGNNIRNNEKIFYLLKNGLESSGFSVSVDQPFMGGNNTISGNMIDFFPNVWTIQIEIDCALTNRRKNFEKCKKLLKSLENWLENVEKEK